MFEKKAKRQKKATHLAKLKRERIAKKRKERVRVTVKVEDPFLVLDPNFVKKASPRRVQKVYKNLIAKISNLKYEYAWIYGGFDNKAWQLPKKEGLSDREKEFLKSLTLKEFVEKFFIAMSHVTKDGALIIAKSLDKSYFKQEN